MKRTIIFCCTLLIACHSYSQGMVRDGFLEILGKKVESSEVQEFFKAYDIKATAGGKCSSATNGIDIDTKKDSVVTVNVYRDSPVYGKFSGKLSMGLRFGMIPPQVAEKLGKPKTTYTNSGYSEYSFDGFMITCWFEQGALSQVSLSPQ